MDTIVHEVCHVNGACSASETMHVCYVADESIRSDDWPTGCSACYDSDPVLAYCNGDRCVCRSGYALKGDSECVG